MSARYFGLVPAAGSGSRFGSDVLKQYSPLAGKPMLYHSIERLLATPEVEIVFVVLAPGDTEFRRHDWSAFGNRLAPLYCGGAAPPGGGEMRIGQGYDVHALVKGRKLIVGGVAIPFEKGLAGHSDADVLVHAVCDALLGAAALGDIGRHFPDGDPKFKNADSRAFLRQAAGKIRDAGFSIAN